MRGERLRRIVELAVAHEHERIADRDRARELFVRGALGLRRLEVALDVFLRLALQAEHVAHREVRARIVGRGLDRFLRERRRVEHELLGLLAQLVGLGLVGREPGALQHRLRHPGR